MVVGNPRLPHSHALDRVANLPRLSKSIVADNQVLKNNKNTIENIDLENKATYL